MIAGCGGGGHAPKPRPEASVGAPVPHSTTALPTTPITAKPVEEVDADHGAFAGRYGRNTLLINLLGLGAVSLPCGFTDDGLPIGLMVTAKPFREDMALRVAYAYEQATGWHRRRPDLDWIG